MAALAQSFSNGTNNIRTLNTISYGFASIVTLASNTFSINRPGAYEIAWFCPTNTANSGGTHQSFLHNITASAEIKRGTGGLVDIGDTDSGDTTFSQGSAVVSITGTTSYDIRHYTETNVLRGGQTVSVGTEIYARVNIRAA